MVRVLLLSLLVLPVASIQMKRDTQWPIFASEPAEPSDIKLVVNSHVGYGRVLDKFMESLKKANFNRWNDVIVVKAGAKDDSISQDWGTGVTYINSQLNNYDLTGLSALNTHKDDPHVKAKSYMYLLDTSTVGAGFPEKFAQFGDTENNELRMAPRPNSNLFVFGAGVVEKYGNNFDTLVSKEDGVCHEMRGAVIRGVQPIENFAEKQDRPWSGREGCWGKDEPGSDCAGTDIDVYKTGHGRKPIYYPDVDVTKYVLWEAQGDILDEAKKTVALKTNPGLMNLISMEDKKRGRIEPIVFRCFDDNYLNSVRDPIPKENSL